jgi:periplasmic divalent cation tolerance protein
MAGEGPAAGAEARFLQVQTTTDSRAEAVELAHEGVSARLAACAQVAGPIASTYWWENSLERAEEWLVIFKLPADRYQRSPTSCPNVTATTSPRSSRRLSSTGRLPI